ncbi:YifB family Mg chelatase-like AAA ATPase [Pokkaliibacter sp. MBI-7]|uniref:YifB family Mg chelatase-like AAA ATPase n=1 Tax=Pokkaliibacter sp. MBI-7 TaxID=3040600 RepID=UPI00244BB036|nr:YifB family Mg chelatase-like AAA ATPase [Pokkaliibacter sp. MBI-7]MDH2433299.1 YifB family Mg chelatase-like AAA ATPase [Pokkaliibacter sp. MBI-7]
MTLAVVNSRALLGVDAPSVTVEVHISAGLPALNMVGLPEAAVRESKERVRSAIQTSQLEFPLGRITVNLAPADLPKTGGRYDLAIALGILAASGQIPLEPLKHLECIGELALDGRIRPVPGALVAARASRDARRCLVLPADNAPRAALVQQAQLLPVTDLLGLCAHLKGLTPLPFYEGCISASAMPDYPDILDVKGQQQAKRALQVVASGGHNALLFGPPGTGKTLLASRLPGLLPVLDEEEALEVAAVESLLAGYLEEGGWPQRPFRAPHHSASAAALVGGGSDPRPGDISLAHQGVLFLDELPEFDRKVLEVMREPLESGHITLSRARAKVTFPARFQLIAAMNPCPCGYHGDSSGRCQCSAEQIRRYRSRLSGPLLDRIDLHLRVQTPDWQTLRQAERSGPNSAQIRQQVTEVRQLQLQRQGCLNAHLQGQALDQFCDVDEATAATLRQAVDRLGLSARAYHRVLRVSRTLADMAGEAQIGMRHVLEALSYRQLDRPV